MATVCGHPSMQGGKCPDCGISGVTGHHSFCGRPWDDHSGFLDTADADPKSLRCPVPSRK